MDPEIALEELDLPARQLRPGDFLPPQRALHGTPFRSEGFTVGAEPSDVVAATAALSGRMLLFGPAGVLRSLTLDATVTVRRAA
jgi:hypothetical protein